jgi:hypothetical protein
MEISRVEGLSRPGDWGLLEALQQNISANKFRLFLIFPRLLKKGQMPGSRNPESGVATNKERHLATPTSW